MAISWTKTWSASDDGSVLSGGDIGVIQADVAAGTVNLSGAQTVAGVKTFSDIPVLPATDPTSDNQPTRKAYVDAQATSVALDMVIHGLEVTWASATTVSVYSGALYHGTTRINKTTSTTLTLATAGDWYDGNTHSYAGGAGWCYIGIDSSSNIKLLHTNAADKADTDGNTAGTKLYYYYTSGTIYYRVLGAAWINTSNNAVQVYNLGNNGLNDNNPIGTIHIWSTDLAPFSYLLCDGTAISRTTYAALFGIISTVYGVGDGSTTFNVPDLRGRIPLGQDDMGGSSANRVTAAAADSLAGSGGAETHTLITAEMPAHTHTINQGGAGNGISVSSANSGGAGATSSTGGDGAHNNLQPYITLNYIIKY